MPSSIDSEARAFERMRARLIAISLRIVGSAAEAEDIVQDCYLRWRRADRAALATPAAWLTTVVQHASIDRLRRRAREDAAARGAQELAPCPPAPVPEQPLLRRAELEQALALMLSRLSPAERLALVLHEALECGHADIAAALGTTAVNARQYLSRARRRLREAEREMRPDQRLCRELVRRFQAAINGADLPAVVSLLGDEQPLSVLRAAPVRSRGAANQACHALAA